MTININDVDFKMPLTKALDELVNDKDWRSPSLLCITQPIGETVIHGKRAQIQLTVTRDVDDFMEYDLGDVDYIKKVGDK